MSAKSRKMPIQSVLFDNRLWTISAAIAWLDAHGYVHYKVDVTKNRIRFRQYNPKKSEHYRTFKDDDDDSIELIVGFPNGVHDDLLLF